MTKKEEKETVKQELVHIYAEACLFNDLLTDVPLNYEETVASVVKNHGFSLPGYLPPCRCVEKREGDYYFKPGLREDLVNLLWANCVYDIFRFRNEEELRASGPYLDDLWTEFQFILDRQYSPPMFLKLRALILEYAKQYTAFQDKLAEVLRGIVRGELKKGADITELVEASGPLRETVLGLVVEKSNTFREGRYYLEVTDRNTREFKAMLYFTMRLRKPEHAAEFISQVVHFFWLTLR